MPGPIATAFVELRADDTRFRREVSTSASKAGDEGGRGWGHGFAAAAAGAVGAIGAGAIVSFGLQAAAGLEMTQVGFEGLLGSAEEAQAMMEKLTAFAATTPLEMPGLADMTKNLLASGQAFGVTQDNVLDFVTTIGDITSELGGGQVQMDLVTRALGQMGNTATVMAGDLNQVSNSLPGFNSKMQLAQGIAEKYGITVDEANQKVEDGEISGAEAAEILLDRMREFPGAAGSMERSSTTLTGILSTFKDTATLALVNGLQPLLEGLKDMLPAISAPGGALEGLAGNFGELAGVLFTTIAPAIGPLMEILGSLADALGVIAEAALPPLVDLFVELAPLIEDMAQILGEVLGQSLGDVAGILGIIVPLLAKGLLVALKLLKPILPVIVTGFIALKVAMATNPVVLLVAALAALAYGLYQAYLRFQGFRDVVDAAWQIMQSVWDFVSNTFVEVWHDLQGAIDAVGEVLGNLFSGDFGAAWDGFKDIIVGVKDAIVGWLSDVDWSDVAATVWDGISSAAKTALSTLASFVGGIASRIVTWLGDIDWSGIGQNVWAFITGAVVPALANVASWVGGLPAKFLSWLGNINWGGIASAIWGFLSTQVPAALRTVGSWFGGLFDKIKTWLAEIDWTGIGTFLLDALKLGAAVAWSGITSVASWFVDMFGKVKAWITSINWAGIGQTILDALKLGATAAWNGITTVGSWFADLFGKVTAWITSVDWKGVGETILNSLKLGATVAWNGLQTVAPWFVDFAGKVKAWLAVVPWGEIGDAIVKKLGDWVILSLAKLGQAASWLAGMGGKLVEWIDNTDFSQVGQAIVAKIGGLFGGGEGGGAGGGVDWTPATKAFIEGYAKALFVSFVTLPVSVARALGELALGLITGLADQLNLENNLTNLIQWAESLPGKLADWILAKIGDLTDKLAGPLVGVVTAILNGLITAYNNTIARFPGVDEIPLIGADTVITIDQGVANDAIARFSTMVRDGTAGARDAAIAAITEIIPAFASVATDSGSEFGQALDTALADNDLTTAEMLNLLNIAEAGAAAGAEAGTDTAAGFGDSFAGFKWSGPVGEAIDSMRSAMTKLSKSQLLPTFAAIPKDGGKEITRFASSALKQPGQDLIDGMKSGIDKGLADVKTRMSQLNRDFGTWIGNLDRVLTVSGAALMTGFLNGMKVGFVGNVQPYLLTVDDQVKKDVGDLGTLLSTTGSAVMSGFGSGIVAGYRYVSTWLGGLGDAVRRAVGGISLYNAGAGAMASLGSGIVAGYRYVSAWLGGLSSRVVTSTGSIGLYNVGANAMSSLASGMLDYAWVAYTAAAAIARNVAAIIRAALRIGSPSKVFIDIGEQTMAGFQIGLAQGWSDTQDQLSSLGSQLSGMMSPTINGVAAGGINVTVEFHGALPTDDQAYSAGKSAASGVADELARRRVRTLVRTGSGS